MVGRTVTKLGLSLPIAMLLAAVASSVSTATLAADASAVAALPSNGMGGAKGTFPAESMQVAGIERKFRLVVPAGIDPTKAAPLVFALHGLFDSKDTMSFYSKLDQLAAKENFILIYPNARRVAWPLAIEPAKDDFTYFDALYDLATGKYNVDLNRVYLTGMSNGAYFSHVLASQRSEKIAAIACHSGGIGLIGVRQPNIAHKYAVFAIHGDADRIVPVAEGRKVRDTYKQWGHPVEYFEIAGGPHFWANKQDINAKIWAFFAAHPRETPNKK